MRWRDYVFIYLICFAFFVFYGAAMFFAYPIGWLIDLWLWINGRPTRNA